MNAIPISGIDQTARPFFIELDDYVPIAFRSYAPLLGGVRDVRLGNLRTDFLELTLGIDSNTLRGFTLICFEAVHEFGQTGPSQEEPGLPVLELDEARFVGPSATQRIDLPMTFSVGFGDDCIEINFGILSAADRAFVCGPVKFLVNEDSLLGIQVLGLTREQLKKIRNMRSN